MNRFDPKSLYAPLRKYPLIARGLALVNLLLYPVLIPAFIVIEGFKAVKGDIRQNFLEIVSAVFLPWKKTK
jgi:hypothetical protein